MQEQFKLVKQRSEEQEEHSFIHQNLDESIVTLSGGEVVTLNKYFFTQFKERIQKLIDGPEVSVSEARTLILNVKLFRLFETEGDKEKFKTEKTRLNSIGQDSSAATDFSLNSLLKMPASEVSKNVYVLLLTQEQYERKEDLKSQDQDSLLK